MSFDNIFRDDIYKDLPEEFEARFETSIMNQIDHYLKEKN